MSFRLLEIKNLKTYFFTEGAVIHAVENVNMEIEQGTILGLVGESGSGKSTVALSIMRLIRIPGRIISGCILLEGEDLLQKREDEMRSIRGGRVSMSFQDPMTFLNPVMRVGDQIAEAIRIHNDLSDREAKERAIAIMEMLEIPAAKKRAKDYPHQFSGGMRQRIMLGIAVACKPKLLIIDEPTTALDVIIQDEILELLESLTKTMAILLITHDLGIVSELANTVAVMYAGHIVEIGSKEAIFSKPRHPYTAALLDSIPRLDRGKKPLRSIQGSVPDMSNPPPGCKFHPRCLYARDICRESYPEPFEIEQGHSVSCFAEINPVYLPYS